MVREIEAVVDPLGRCNPANAARILDKSVQTLANWRTAGTGPAWFKINGRVYYRYDDLVAFGSGEVQAQAA